MRQGKKITVHKSGSSNFLVDRTKTMVKLIIFVSLFIVKDEFPNSKVRVRKMSVLSNNLWWILLKLFWSVQRSLLYKRQWWKKWIPDSTSVPQLHIELIETWKVCLNLYSHKWLTPSRILVIYLISKQHSNWGYQGIFIFFRKVFKRKKRQNLTFSRLKIDLAH